MSDIVGTFRSYALDKDNCPRMGSEVIPVRVSLLLEAAAEITRLRIANIQMQAALGYAICAEDERHIMPTNPYRCGICDANKGLRDEITRLRAALERMLLEFDFMVEGGVIPDVRNDIIFVEARAALQQEVK